jgi:serine phosphatase RsbU (regulator of sigma subunit)
MIRLVWLAVAVAAGTAALVWARSARYRARLAQRLDVASGDSDLKQLARAGLRRDVHTTVLYATVAVAGVVGALTASGTWVAVTLVAVGLPVGLTVAMAATMRANARLEMGRSQLERRAQQVLVQDQLAPRRWSQRLAPDDLAAVDGLEVGRAYQPGDGMLAGDFYDLVVVGPDRVAAVVGDVSGHGIEPAITAFQAKYLLRVFLRQFRDPAQAVEELNRQMASIGRPDEFVSLWVAVHDNGVGTLRYVSAGHPPAWLWHDRDVVPLSATGPLLMLDPASSYHSVEVPLDSGDLLVVTTDGLTEARNGDELFGEERIATTLRRDPGVAPDVLCKSLLEAATDFSSGPITDDVAILALRRT